jgi:ABC-type branched-subunit amino acid transport system ATPase component
VSDAALLELRGVRAAVGSFQILQGIDFTVTEGRTTVVLGRNGVGKTTTLRTIMGYVRDTQGSIRHRGEELRGQPPHRVARRGIAYVPEDRGIFGQLTVGENLRLAAPDAAAWEPGLELFPALRERLKDRAGALSGGQQQMLTVARALAQRPDLPAVAAMEAAVGVMLDLARDLNIPPLERWGVGFGDVTELIALARKASSMRYNPVSLSDAALADVLYRAGVQFQVDA